MTNDMQRLRAFVAAYAKNNPFRTADMHSDDCHCVRCLHDWVGPVADRIEAQAAEIDLLKENFRQAEEDRVRQAAEIERLKESLRNNGDTFDKSELVERVAKSLCAVEQDTGNITICEKVCPYCDASACAAIRAVTEWILSRGHTPAEGDFARHLLAQLESK